MARFHGIRGTLSMGSGLVIGSAIKFSKWEINIEVDNSSALPLDTGTDTKWEETFAGGARWTGNIEGYLDDTTTADDVFDLTELGGNSATATFTDGGSHTYTGTIVIGGLVPTNGNDDVGKFTCSFKGSGALAFA